MANIDRYHNDEFDLLFNQGELDDEEENLHLSVTSKEEDGVGSEGWTMLDLEKSGKCFPHPHHHQCDNPGF